MGECAVCLRRAVNTVMLSTNTDYYWQFALCPAHIAQFEGGDFHLTLGRGQGRMEVAGQRIERAFVPQEERAILDVDTA